MSGQRIFSPAHASGRRLNQLILTCLTGALFSWGFDQDDSSPTCQVKKKQRRPTPQAQYSVTTPSSLSYTSIYSLNKFSFQAVQTDFQRRLLRKYNFDANRDVDCLKIGLELKRLIRKTLVVGDRYGPGKGGDGRVHFFNLYRDVG